MLILKTIICGRHLEENYKVTGWCTLRWFESGPFFCATVYLLGEQGGCEGSWMHGGKGGEWEPGNKRGAAQKEYVCMPYPLACLHAGKKKMKFSSVLFLWQIQLLWGLVQSGVTSKRQKLKTWQLMKWQMTRKFRQGPSVTSNTWRKIAATPQGFPKTTLSTAPPLQEKRHLLPTTFYQATIMC